MNEMTASEKAWFNRLYRLLNAMPPEVEIEVHHGHVQMNRKGARKAGFDLRGDGDNSESIDSFPSSHMRFYPVSESI